MIHVIDCPICRRPLAPTAASDSPLFPFCSKRCQQIDLLRWTEGRYAVVEPLTIDRLLEETAGGLAGAELELDGLPPGGRSAAGLRTGETGDAFAE